jgi:hypothetical protein
MRATLLPVVLPLPQPQEGMAPRTPGVHVSSVIRQLALKKGYLKFEQFRAEELSLVELNQAIWWAKLSPVDRLRMSIGLAWEEWYLRQIPGVIKHPGEMCVDGIYMTHDGEALDLIAHQEHQYRVALHEVKATYKSTKTVGNLLSQWMWLAQTKCYCKGLETCLAYLHVLFLCGDYKYPIQPQLRCWQIEYDPYEIESQWREVVTEVRDARLHDDEESLKDIDL